MTFNPLQEKGMPLETQLRNWSELNVAPYDKFQTDPYTKCRAVVMNGVEIESIMFSHQFARNTVSDTLKKQLASVRRIEQQQQKAIAWLVPGTESTLEHTITYEQVAVDLTAWVARNEPDPYMKRVYEFGLLEDFDHLYRYANLLDLLDHKKAELLVGGYTEIIPGRPTIFEHRHPEDEIRLPLDRTTAHPLSLLHALTVLSAEQQTMNFYMTIGNRYMEPIARGLYLEIAQIEEQHVTHYESTLDARASWAENLVMHEYNECYLYYSFLQQESDLRIRQLWELHLSMEIEHLRIANDILREMEGRDAEEMFPSGLPEALRFEPNIDYIRQVLQEQVDLRADGPEFVPVDLLPPDHRYFRYQDAVNAGAYVPSEAIIAEHRARRGEDYRFEADGVTVRQGAVELV